MDSAFSAQTKKKLLQEQERLQKELKRIREQPASSEGAYPSRYPHAEGSAMDEEAEEFEEFSNLIAVERTLSKRLEAVEEALGRIKNGTYGICERCKKPIATERLERSPEAKTCTNCAKS